MSMSLEWSSLSALRPFFSAVPKGGGNLDTDQFWAMLVKEHNLTLDTSSVMHVVRAKGIKNARMLQEKAAGMLLTLQTLARSLEEINATFKERTDCMALRHGLDNLPDEILSHILGSVTSMFTEALGLSHVCSRLRKVMLDSPRIWANCRLNTNMNPRQVGILVHRSRNCPLKVDIDSYRLKWERVEYLFSLKDRLEDLKFHWINFYESEQFSKHYPEIQMPCLRKLTINDAYMPTRSLPFYDSWTLPNLKYLGFTNFIPKQVFRQNLSYCHMKFIEFFEPEELKHFLQSLTSLETLEIEIVDLFPDDEDSDDEENDSNDNSVQEDLSSISSFSFSVIGETSVSFTTRVLEAIRPNVTEMLFTIVHPKCDNRDDYSKIHSRRACLLEPMQHFSALKKLHLHFSGPDDSYYIDLGEILPLMPRLETLRIEAPRHSLMPLHNYTPSRRRAIRFWNRDSLYLDRRKAGCDAVVYNNVVIGRFEVVGCCLDDEEIFRGAFPNSEVVWIP